MIAKYAHLKLFLATRAMVDEIVNSELVNCNIKQSAEEIKNYSSQAYNNFFQLNV